jgi:hypothetical protein
MTLSMKRSKPLFILLVCILVTCMLFVNVPAVFATDPATTLQVYLLNPDGTQTWVHTYSYNDLESLAIGQKFATIDAMPAGVGTVSHGVPIAALAEDAATYNPGITWAPGQKIILYPNDAPGTPYQGTEFYTYDKLETARYYYPNMVECFTAYRQSGDPGDLDTALDNPVPVESVLSITSYQGRYLTDNDLDDLWNNMNSLDTFRFCMGLTADEAEDGIEGTYSSTNKFCKWVYKVAFGPIKGQEVTADTTNNITGQQIDMTFTDNAAWRNAISSITVDGIPVDPSHYTITAGNISFDSTVFTTIGNHSVVIAAAGYMNSNVTQPIGGIAPELNADTSNNALDQPIDVTFTDNVDWRNNISSVTINGSPVTNYTLAAGKLTFPESVFTVTGDYTITVNATNYNSTSVTQSILLAYPSDIHVDGVRVGDQDFALAFTDDPAWRAAITDIIVGGTSNLSYCTISAGRIEFVNADIHSVSYDLVIQATGYPDVVTRLAPAITPDTTENGVNQTSVSNGGIVLTYTNHPLLPSYNDAITDVKVNGDSIAGYYTKTSGTTITINNSVFTAAGTYTITVCATGYLDATTVQTICPLGDINFDGVINDTDIDLVASYVVGTETPTAAQFIAADVNMDGVIDDIDIYSIMELAGY